MALGGKGKPFFPEKKRFPLPPEPPIPFQKKRSICAPVCRTMITGSWVRLVRLVRLVGHAPASHAPLHVAASSVSASPRLLGNSPTTGATTNRLRSTWQPAVRPPPAPIGFAQERYRTAGRVLPRSRDRSVLAYVTRAATTARLARASEIAP